MQADFCPSDAPESSSLAHWEDSLLKLCSAWGLHGNLSRLKQRLSKVQAPGGEASRLGEPTAPHRARKGNALRCGGVPGEGPRQPPDRFPSPSSL